MSERSDGILRRPQDMVFVGLMIMCLLISLAAIRSQFDQRSLTSASVGRSESGS